jgi:hypothetical protein
MKQKPTFGKSGFIRDEPTLKMTANVRETNQG